MAIKLLSATYNGIEGKTIEVEVCILKGLPSFTIVGLPDTSIKESKERVRSAIVSMGFKFPLGRIIVNLAPANIRKIGSLLDLPIAIALLMESNQILKQELDDTLFLGELSLTGEINKVNGVLPIILNGEDNYKYIVPRGNNEDCSFINSKNIFLMEHLSEVVSYINYGEYEEKAKEKVEMCTENNMPNFDEIIGHEECKRVMTIAAAGMHNLILYGIPGCGKTLLANSIKSILPPTSEEEALEIAKVYSVHGDIKGKDEIRRPFRKPHHSITQGALIGGGKDIKPGEISLAHGGVLFLDEMLEYKKELLDSLRQPLEEGEIQVDRIQGRVKLPCKFLLIGALNPCPCGKNSIDPREKNSCTCTPLEKRRYQNKFSKALRDRIDIFCYVPRIKGEDIKNINSDYTSDMMKGCVSRALDLQRKRYKNTKYLFNSELKGKDVYKYIKLNRECKNFLQNYYDSEDISLRGYEKIIKLSRTIADIDGNEEVQKGNIIEAITYRRNIGGELV
ncbi:MAG: YifB family Mg chelatase-like AAA ATPase [Clostridium sp.]